MKRVKLILLLFIFSVFLLSSCFKTGQVKVESGKKVNIEDWHFAFELPSEKWSLHNKQNDKINGKALYGYKREELTDSKNKKVVSSYIGIVFDKIPKDMDVIHYSINCRMGVGFEVEKVFTHHDGIISLKNAVGYIGKYIDSQNIEHTIIVVHAIHKQIGVQIIMDTTTELFPIVENEFNKTLKTLRFTE